MTDTEKSAAHLLTLLQKQTLRIEGAALEQDHKHTASIARTIATLASALESLYNQLAEETATK